MGEAWGTFRSGPLHRLAHRLGLKNGGTICYWLDWGRWVRRHGQY